MDFRVFDQNYQNRLYLLDDYEVQFRDREATVPASVAYRMSRYNDAEFVIEDQRVPFNPDSWGSEKRLIWKCNVSAANGFGMVAENTIKELLRQGVTVLNPGGISGNWISGGEFVDQSVHRSFSQRIEPDCLEIQHCQPPAIKDSIVERIWCYTMFETDHTPKSWIKRLNEVEHVLVPSSWLVDSWQEQGLKRPISVYGHGIDPAVYYPLERPDREVYTFLHYGQLSIRKGTDLVMEAFRQEFRESEPVRLILKNTYPIFPVPLHVPNVEYLHATYSKDQMRELLFRSDCLVYPHRGEGFGLSGLEAMATGLPVIVTNWSGTVDYSDPSDTLLLDYTMQRSYEFDGIYKDFFEPGEHSGRWAEPSLEDLRAKMRWCYEHRDAAKVLGKRAAARIGREWTWDRKVGQLIAEISTGSQILATSHQDHRADGEASEHP